MASLPPISQDGSLDTFSASLAGYRSKALGRRKIRTREVASEPLQLLTYRHEMTTGKFGPRTPLTVPKSLLASSLSQRDLALMSERFSLSRCKQRGGSSAVIPAAIRSSVPVSPIREEEIKERRSGQGAELADFASRLKNANPIMLFCTKVLGEGHRPEAREGGSFTAINRKLYLFGGRCRRLFNDVKVLDPTTLRWDEPRLNSTLGGLPEPRVNHTAVAYQSQLIVYGGCERFNDILQIRNCFPLIHIYETGTFYLESNTWTSAKPLGRSPEPRRCHSAVIVGKVMFFFGGMDRAGKVLDDLEAINLGEIYVETMSWLAPTMVKRTIKPGPRAASSFTAVFSPEALSSPSMDLFNPPKAYDEVFTPSTTGIYLLSGLNDKGEACNDVHVLKVKKMSVRDDRPSLMWVKPDLAGTPPESRYDHSACLCGKCVYIYGGRNDSLYGSKGKCELNSFGILNIESQRWDRVELLGAAPSGRWSHSMASVDTKLFIFGGMKLSKFCSSVLNILETDQTITQDKAATLKDTKGKLGRKPTLIRSTVKRSTIFKR